MFGYLRFILAFFVLISHVDIRISGLNPGVTAVVIFYLLAGHVVSHLWDNVLPRRRFRLWFFYRDRIMRVMPMYLYITGLTLIFLVLTGYGDPQYSVLRLLGNLLVVPVNYYMVLDTTILTDPSWALIPTAWSLGAELQAYALLPLALHFRRWGLVLAGVSFVVYMLANVNVLHPDYFGYRLLPGIFFMFMTGAWIQRAHNKPTGLKSPDLLIPWLLWAGVICLFAAFYSRNLFTFAYTRETFLGLLLGIPLVFFGCRTQMKLPLNSLLGSLSYGVFLTHFLVIWTLDHAGLLESGTPFHILTITAGSVLIAFIGVRYMERYVDRIRKFRK